MLNVTLYSRNAEGKLVADLDEEVEYVSYFNGGTHGPPALVAPGRQDGRAVQPTARPGEAVLYVNTSLVPVVLIERMVDE